MKPGFRHPAHRLPGRPDDKNATIGVGFVEGDAPAVWRERRRRFVAITIAGDNRRVASADAADVDVPAAGGAAGIGDRIAIRRDGGRFFRAGFVGEPRESDPPRIRRPGPTGRPPALAVGNLGALGDLINTRYAASFRLRC
jgi:hypothetical protein